MHMILRLPGKHLIIAGEDSSKPMAEESLLLDVVTLNHTS